MIEAQRNEHTSTIVGLTNCKIYGVFSSQFVQTVGTGTTSRKTIQEVYWFAEELPDEGLVEVQALNVNCIPAGDKQRIPKDEFLDTYSPELEFYVSTVFPKMQAMQRAIMRGEQHRKDGNSYSAEFEFDQVMKVDKENVRANFGLGLTYLERGNFAKSEDIFKRLVKLDAAFSPQHKHLFNEFGMNLRQNKMFSQALEYYMRAESLDKTDENLYHNIARVYYDMGNVKKCVEYLKRSLEFCPTMQESRQFMDFITSSGKVPMFEDIPAAFDTKDTSNQGKVAMDTDTFADDTVFLNETEHGTQENS